MRALQLLAKLGKNRRDVADAGGARALLTAVVDTDIAIADAAARALFSLCNHLEVCVRMCLVVCSGTKPTARCEKSGA